MRPRYTVRARFGEGYLIWDNENDRIATSPEGREYVDLRFAEAFETCDRLNLNLNKNKNE
jgi:hypothetical protein